MNTEEVVRTLSTINLTSEQAQILSDFIQSLVSKPTIDYDKLAADIIEYGKIPPVLEEYCHTIINTRKAPCSHIDRGKDPDCVGCYYRGR